MKKWFLVLTLAAISVSGCATHKEMVPVGGSRADGTVRLAYEYTLFEKPQVNGQQAMSAAQSKCSAWGYTRAEAFGGGSAQCLQVNGYGNCIHTRVTYEFQCIGAPTTATK
jgi:hypothetical protein